MEVLIPSLKLSRESLYLTPCDEDSMLIILSSTGTPQVVLPFWYDTYEYANRAEWLGIGIYGNRRSAPTVEALELGRALTRIVGDGEEARRFRATAEALRERCIGYTGRVLAAEKVLEIAAAE